VARSENLAPLHFQVKRKPFASNLCIQQADVLFYRHIFSGEGADGFPENKVHNQKYNVITFLPIVLYEQFKFFANMYFLVVALTQFVDALKVG